MNDNNKRLDAILDRALQEDELSSDDIVFLLGLEHPDHIDELFEAARSLRRRYFGSKIFLYGFIYASTYCRNDCRFCFFRKSNSDSRRYRKTIAEIIASAVRLADSGVHLIDLTMGEDPVLFNGDGTGCELLMDMVKALRSVVEVPVMVSPGVLPDSDLNRMAEAGAVWYACYQETHNQRLFSGLRPGQDYETRLQTKINAHHYGLLIEEGLMCGIGETAVDIAQSMKVMKALNADQIRIMSFVPQPGTPMGDSNAGDSAKEVLTSAVMRLVFPDRLIPASLDVDGLAGLKQRLSAGANVVTSIVPPGEGLTGVARPAMDIEDGRRTAASVKEVLKQCGLSPATNLEYQKWLDCRRQVSFNVKSNREAVCE